MAFDSLLQSIELNTIDLSLLHSLGFVRYETVVGCHSIADLFPSGERCGIYILHFADGWLYVGQAVEITRRYAQHRQVHLDMERISFKPVGSANLDAEEQTAVRILEDAGYRLRNIALVSMPIGETDFDVVMDRAEQDRWLVGGTYPESTGNRVTDSELRTKYHQKYQQFRQMPHSADAIALLRTYAQKCVPAFVGGEQSFWSCTCLPGHPDRSTTILSRININWQEVFTTFLVDGQLCATWHLARSPFGDGLHWRFTEQKLWWRYRAKIDPENRYAPGGDDQCAVTASGIGNLVGLLTDRQIVAAARLLNLRLCRKGPNQSSRYHCLDLADELISQGETNV